MNEEEKEVVELLQHCQNTYIEDTLVTHLQLTTEEAKILLNLVEKQQKEIYRLQNIKRKDIQDLINVENENIYKNYIHKDTIRKKLEKIEELYDEKVEAENFEYNNNQFIVDFIALVEELLEV